jgi:hypothetical protein
VCEILSGLYNSWQLSIIDSIVYGISSLPEAKRGPVGGVPKIERDSCRLHTLAFNYLDLFFCQPVKLVDQDVYAASFTWMVFSADIIIVSLSKMKKIHTLLAEISNAPK